MGIVVAQYRAPLSFELDMGRIEVNTHPDVKRVGGYSWDPSSGWSAQPNVILHEFGHMVDHYMEDRFPKMGKEALHDRTLDLTKDEIKKTVSEYATRNSDEYKAEVISSILAGKSYPKKFLESADLDRYLSDERGKSIFEMGSGAAPNTSMLEKQFGSMMEALYHESGASLRIELLNHPEVAKFTESHARVLDNSFQQVQMSDAMRKRLQESDYVFSGIKTFHELNEAFPSLLDEKGERKPFERFLNDVQTIDRTYNKNYLRTEYNFVSASSEMAGRWENFEKDGDDYYLQYRTAGDDKVRPEHAALNGVTLPQSDPFWDEYYPPNGWNCRCTVVQVVKGKNSATDRAEAFKRGEEALVKDTKGFFRFNPGKEGKTVPDYNPYTISRCRTCDIAKGKMSLSKPLDCDLCKACQKLRMDSSGDVTELLKSLHEKRGADYIQALRDIASLRIFKKTDVKKVWSAIGEDSPDYDNLLSAAGKLANHGFEVFILPNPGSTRSGDYILRRKNFIGLYDLKTITGNNSIDDRLAESIGQTHRVILNITSNYNPRKIAKSLERYFNNKGSKEVKIIKGNKLIEIEYKMTKYKNLEAQFRKLYR